MCRQLARSYYRGWATGRCSGRPLGAEVALANSIEELRSMVQLLNQRMGCMLTRNDPFGATMLPCIAYVLYLDTLACRRFLLRARTSYLPLFVDANDAKRNSPLNPSSRLRQNNPLTTVGPRTAQGLASYGLPIVPCRPPSNSLSNTQMPARSRRRRRRPTSQLKPAA